MSNEPARSPVASLAERPVEDEFLLIILSSPSGAGKTTLKNRLLSAHPELRFSVSHTTRKPRPTEKDGREYHFVDRGQFEAMIAAGAFAEWAEVHGNLYGTSLAEIEVARVAHRGVVFDIDYQGARQIKAKLPSAVGVFILPPSMPELERRLRARATEEEHSLRTRLAAARREIEHYGFCDYVVVNDDATEAAARLEAIVLAERSRRWRTALVAERLLATNEVRA